MLTNSKRHLIAAMIVTPLLAVGAYVLVDQAVSERPQAAMAGVAYPLRAQSNCRYPSGVCVIDNAEFSATLRVERRNGSPVLVLDSSHPLRSAVVGIVSNDGVAAPPVSLLPQSDDKKTWTRPMDESVRADSGLRIALRVKDTHYFVETSTAFVQYRTVFDEDFRRNSP